MRQSTDGGAFEPVWFKSSYSGGNDGESCVECAVGPGAVRVRDSKQGDGPRIVLSAGAWGGFLGFVVGG
ncbi:DUF397 domain-containing protein [Streptomyces sp. NPDC086091]|uniref:DUF397 domain-containing protein n=1 Tax=Streptomyces sp. NPDC086091 TaxID=3365751 RepID=UPI0037FB7F61